MNKVTLKIDFLDECGNKLSMEKNKEQMALQDMVNAFADFVIAIHRENFSSEEIRNAFAAHA